MAEGYVAEELDDLCVGDTKISHLISNQNAATLGLTTDEAELSISDTIFPKQLDSLYN
jgi:hypothetical protein